MLQNTGEKEGKMNNQDLAFADLGAGCEISSIKSFKQYDLFGKVANQLEEKAVDKGVPIRSLARADSKAFQHYLSWKRTPEGVLLNAIHAAMYAWEDATK